MAQTAQDPHNPDDEAELEAPVSEEIEAQEPEGSGTPEGAQEAPDEMAELRRQLEEQTRQADQYKREAETLRARHSEAETRIASEVNSRFTAQEQAIEARINGATAALSKAKADMVQAQAEGRWEDAANLAESIADHRLQLNAANWDKNNIAAQKEMLTASAARAADPVEAFIANIPGERSRAWLRAHPDIARQAATDRRAQQKLYSLAAGAEAEGFEPDSEAYFDHIERGYGLKGDPSAVQPNPAKPAPARQPGKTAAAAPSTRSAPPSQRRIVSADAAIKSIMGKMTDADRESAKISAPRDMSQEDAEKMWAQGVIKVKASEPNFRPDLTF